MYVCEKMNVQLAEPVFKFARKTVLILNGMKRKCVQHRLIDRNVFPASDVRQYARF